MNRKQLIVLVAALIVIGGAWLVMNKHDEQAWNPSGSKLGEKVLPNFQVNDVAAMHIKGEADLNLVKKNGTWRVQERDDYPANFSQISDLLIKLGDLKVGQAEPIAASQLAQMHLTEPGSGPEAGTLLEFKDANGKVLQSLVLGKKHVQKSQRPGPMGMGGEMADGRYLMLKSNPNEILTVSDPLDSVDPKAASWLDKDFFKVERPESISFASTNAANSWTLTRESENSPWVLADKKTGEVLDTNKISSLSSALGYPSFVDVAPDQSPAKTGLDKPMTLTIKTFDGFSYVIKIGSKTATGNYNINVAVTGDFPKERKVSKNEKPEGKKLLDTAFADKLKTDDAKLKKEEALDHWTYEVNNWLIDPLIRDRAQLMVEKKSAKKEKKPEAAAETTPEEKPEPADK